MTEGFSGGGVRDPSFAVLLPARQCRCRDGQHATGSASAPMAYVEAGSAAEFVAACHLPGGAA